MWIIVIYCWWLWDIICVRLPQLWPAPHSQHRPCLYHNFAVLFFFWRSLGNVLLTSVSYGCSFTSPPILSTSDTHSDLILPGSRAPSTPPLTLQTCIFNHDIKMSRNSPSSSAELLRLVYLERYQSLAGGCWLGGVKYCCTISRRKTINATTFE